MKLRPPATSIRTKGRGTIEVFTTEDGTTHYRSCAAGMCRYSTDLRQAEIYLDQMLPTS